jgi:hypothetical protein
MRIEDPCAGDIYRPWDGLAYGGPAGQGFSGGTIVSRGTYQGLATLDLAIDDEGYILALRPDINPGSNGIAGEGRIITSDELQDSNQKLMAAASSYVGYALPFAQTMPPDYRLADIRESNQFVKMDGRDAGSALVILEAVYVDHRSYEAITITSPIDRISQYSVERLTRDSDGIVVPETNNTDLRSLLGIYDTTDDNCYFTSEETIIKVPYSIRYGAGIIGSYAILHAPDFSAMRERSSVDDNFNCGSHAVIWGKARTKKKIFLCGSRRRDMILMSCKVL